MRVTTWLMGECRLNNFVGSSSGSNKRPREAGQSEIGNASSPPVSCSEDMNKSRPTVGDGLRGFAACCAESLGLSGKRPKIKTVRARSRR